MTGIGTGYFLGVDLFNPEYFFSPSKASEIHTSCITATDHAKANHLPSVKHNYGSCVRRTVRYFFLHDPQTQWDMRH